MKLTGKSDSKRETVALALTWDGARWPVAGLPPAAREFLNNRSLKIRAKSPGQLARLFSKDEIAEIRICWVPRLKGGDHVLAAPFISSNGKRVSFRIAKTIPFGDVLGVIYRKD